MASRSAIFSDSTVAVAEDRAELSLIGKVFGPAPSVPSMQSFLADLWRCEGSLTILSLCDGLLGFVFSDSSDLARIRDGSPWIQPRYMLHVKSWEEPSFVAVESLNRVPLWVQFWRVPSHGHTVLMARCLGSALGDLKAAAVHIGSNSGGVYLRAKVAIDVTAPLPVSVTASHELQARNPFEATVLYERLPLFCFNCGVIGHPRSRCDRPEVVAAGDVPPYGKDLLARDKGPRVNEHTLRRRLARFSWRRQVEGSASDRRSVVLALPAPLAVAVPGVEDFQRLSLDPPLGVENGSPSAGRVRKRGELEEVMLPSNSKFQCVESAANSDLAVNDHGVEDTGPSRSQFDP
ncbi:unnamed protein product [Linum trigynum]|uniref:CCHC-type domain-containing protein n=1 Tax=Linum trigynum TaxID=586398 RepID=A0AAV2EME9_9ROSI